MFITITEFKESGKYYQEMKLQVTDGLSWYDIIEEVRPKVRQDTLWLLGMSNEHPEEYPILLHFKYR